MSANKFGFLFSYFNIGRFLLPEHLYLPTYELMRMACLLSISYYSVVCWLCCLWDYIYFFEE